AVEDLDAALGWLLVSAPGLGLDLADVAVCGDSAGGNLAVVAALRNPAAFTAAVLVYPFLDPRRAGASYAEENAGLSGAESAWYWQQYAGPDDNPDDNPDDPDLAPLLSERLGTLPRTLVVAAEHDVLLDEDRLLAERIAAAGGEVTCTTYAGMVHGFWRHPALFDDAERCLAEIAAFLHPR
ncbi:MAG: alpha/beta hydrolase fold domain-containing protein, partial [Nocardioides sp.]